MRVVLAWNARVVFAGTWLEITSPQMLFENFDSSFTQQTNALLLLITYSVAGNIQSVFSIFSFTL